MRILLLIAALLAVPGLAFGQTDYSAGKTPGQLFTSDCSACHQSARGLARTRDASSLASFLREHYTTKADSAGALAAYLLSGGNSGPPPAAARQTPAGRERSAAAPPRPPAGVDDSDSQRAGRRAKAGGSPGAPDDIYSPESEPGPKRRGAREANRGDAKPPPKGRQDAQPAGAVPKLGDTSVQAKVRAYSSTGEEAVPKPAPGEEPASTGSPPAAAVTPPAAAISPPVTTPPATASAPAPQAPAREEAVNPRDEPPAPREAPTGPREPSPAAVAPVNEPPVGPSPGGGAAVPAQGSGPPG